MLWPRIPSAPTKEMNDRAGLRLSCVEAALWLEERWQTATGAAGATACSCDAAGDRHDDCHHRHHHHFHTQIIVLTQEMCCSVS